MVDPFWLTEKQTITGQNAAQVMRLPVKPAETKSDRYTSLMSTFKPLAEMASTTKHDTVIVEKALKETLSTIIQTKEGNINDQGDSRVNNNHVEVIANPQLAKKQNQKRHQPHASGAPTTSAAKKAANVSKQKQKQTEKAKRAHALGRT